MELLLTLGSELVVLLVASGESEALTVLLFEELPDLTLYIEEAGMLVTRGRILPWKLRLMSCGRETKHTLVKLPI